MMMDLEGFRVGKARRGKTQAKFEGFNEWMDEMIIKVKAYPEFLLHIAGFPFTANLDHCWRPSICLEINKKMGKF
jgi:hypothetical protein